METVNTVTYLPITAKTLSSIHSVTKEDTRLQRVTDMIQTGRPQNKKDIPTDIQHYHSFQEEMRIRKGIVFRGETEQ